MNNESKKWKLGCFFIAILFIIGLVFITVISFTAGKSKNSIFSGKGIAVVRIEGIIAESETIVQKLNKISENNSIKGIVLRINSPGGAIAPSQEIYAAIKDIRNKGKRVIASFGSVAASGGYYIASACDTIVSNKGTLTGSIGVILQFTSAKDLLDKVGLKMEVIKSGKYKDAGSIHKELNQEEKKLFQNIIDDAQSQFIDAVVKGRGLSRSYVKKYSDGRIFTGKQAKKIGFVDVLGTFEDAKSITKNICNLPQDAKVIDKQIKGRLIDYLSGLFHKVKVSNPGLYYLYLQ